LVRRLLSRLQPDKARSGLRLKANPPKKFQRRPPKRRFRCYLCFRKRVARTVPPRKLHKLAVEIVNPFTSKESKTGTEYSTVRCFNHCPAIANHGPPFVPSTTSPKNNGHVSFKIAFAKFHASILLGAKEILTTKKQKAEGLPRAAAGVFILMGPLYVSRFSLVPRFPYRNGRSTVFIPTIEAGNAGYS